MLNANLRYSKGTFKFHMMLREMRGGLLKLSEYCHMGGRPDLHSTSTTLKFFGIQTETTWCGSVN